MQKVLGLWRNYEIIELEITHQWSIMKLLVRNLSRSTTEQELRILFSAHGTVTECNLVLDQATAKSKGFGFVVMPDEKEAKVALSNLHESKVSNNKIRVKIAQ